MQPWVRRNTLEQVICGFQHHDECTHLCSCIQTSDGIQVGTEVVRNEVQVEGAELDILLFF